MMNFQHLKNVSTLKFEVEKCKGCGICLNVCPRGVLVKNTEDNLVHIEKMNFCIECGACMINCPFGALTVDAGAGCAIAILNGLLKGSKPCC